MIYKSISPQQTTENHKIRSKRQAVPIFARGSLHKKSERKHRRPVTEKKDKMPTEKTAFCISVKRHKRRFVLKKL
ncbi:hypothetical protein DXA74_12240 [Bacteroides sp. OF04-15BH]|nr:hypothetical protein DXA74_12240 [Bacteroides sp. OF04-15BH]